MTMDVTAHKQEITAPVEGPGRLLREARETLNLSQDEVARRLHLSLKLIKALEEDDYKKLPPPIFVTGYLRNYARLTNLSADELISSYNRSGGVPLPPIKMLGSSKQGAEHRSDQPVKLATYAAALAVLVVLLGLWWWQGGDEPAVPGDSGPGAVVPLPQQPADNTQSIQVPIPGTLDTTQTPIQAPIGEIVPVVPSPVMEIPVPNQAQPTVVSPAPSAAAVAVSQATIKLIFEADSWVQITDANERRMFYDLGKEGAIKTLQGTPPFKVTIGYAPGVKIEYNGTPFDHSRFKRNGRANFVLGKATETIQYAARKSD